MTTTTRRTFLGHLALLLAAAPAALRASARVANDRPAPTPATTGPFLDVAKHASDRTVTIAYQANAPVAISVDGQPWVTHGGLAGSIAVPRPAFGEAQRAVRLRVERDGQRTEHQSSIPARASG